MLEKPTRSNSNPLDADNIRQLRRLMHLSHDWLQDNEWADYEALLIALRRDNMRAVNFLLDKGCRVTKPASKNHPLHLAVSKLGWYNIVEKLLTVGARVTDRDEKGDTALHVAFFSHASNYVIDLLLQRYLHETDEDLSDMQGIRFSHIACTRDNVDVIRDFVARAQIDVNCQVSKSSRSIFAGCTLLHFAVEHSQANMVKFLLENNAELYTLDCSGSTALHYALERRDVKIIDLILSYDRRYHNAVNDFGLSHFMAACAGTSREVVRNFLRVVESQSKTAALALINEACKDLNFYKYAGYNSLIFAAEFDRNQTLQLLNVVAARLSLDADPGRPRGRHLAEAEEKSQISFGRENMLSDRLLTNFNHLVALLIIFALSVPTWMLL